MDVVSDVALVGDERRPGVETHADVDRPGRQRVGECYCCSESTGRRGEGEEEGITLSVDLDPALCRARERVGMSLEPRAKTTAELKPPGVGASMQDPTTSQPA